MKPRQIRELILKGEGPKVEFKREVHLSDASGQVEFCKDVSSLANTLNEFGRDGYLLIGVEDNGEIVGISSPLDDQKIQRVLDKYLQPRLQVSVSHVALDGHLVGVIQIPPSYRKPHKIKKSYHDKKSVRADTVFTRHLSQVVIASPEEIVALDQEAARERKRRYLMGALGGFLILLLSCISLWFGLQVPTVQKQVYAILPWERIPFVPDKIDSSALPLSRSKVKDALFGIGRLPAYEIHYSVVGLNSETVFYNNDIKLVVSGYDYHLLKTGDTAMGSKEEQVGIGNKTCFYLSGVNPEQWTCTPRQSNWNAGALEDYPIDVARNAGISDVLSFVLGYYPQNKEITQMYKIYRQGRVAGKKCDIYRSHFQIPVAQGKSVMVMLGTHLIEAASNSEITVREEGCMVDGRFLKYTGVMDFKDKEMHTLEVRVFYEGKELTKPPVIQLPSNALVR